MQNVGGLPVYNIASRMRTNWYLNGSDHFIIDYSGYGV
jgi:hypothetical protein